MRSFIIFKTEGSMKLLPNNVLTVESGEKTWYPMGHFDPEVSMVFLNENSVDSFFEYCYRTNHQSRILLFGTMGIVATIINGIAEAIMALLGSIWGIGFLGFVIVIALSIGQMLVALISFLLIFPLWAFRAIFTQIEKTEKETCIKQLQNIAVELCEERNQRQHH